MEFLCSNLLFLFDETPESAADTLNLICILAVLFTAALTVTLCLKKRAFTAKELAFAGISISAGFLLSFIKLAPVQYGGSITLCSMLPVMLFAYYYGFSHGLLIGTVYGLLQFVQSPYILTVATFALDYVFAFACVAFAAFGAKFKNRALGLTAGTVFTYGARFLMHFLSGLVYFSKNAVWTNLPASSGALYSFLYQTVYLVPDFALTLAAFLLLNKFGIIEKLKPATFSSGNNLSA